MSESIVFGFLALAIFAYGLTGGADFGVGILETVVPRQQREGVRALGEHAIAPVWEANHVWLIIALVICFVGYPGVHVYLTTFLHVPLLMMLVGVVLRGTAFTFRYYDVGDEPAGGGIWTPVFRAGSVLVPFAFGIIAAALTGGRMPAAPTTVWDTYFAPWLAPFPLLTGVFAVCLCGWLAAVFLGGECAVDERPVWTRRARQATVAMMVAGALATTAALLTGNANARTAFTEPVALVSVGLATLLVILLWRLVRGQRFWTQRLVAGGVLGAILLGYFGVDLGTAVHLDDGTRILWHLEAAPEATMRALAGALVVASVLVLPGLFWLYRLFKQPRET